MEFISERKRRKIKHRQVSGAKKYQEDYENYRNRRKAVEEINKVIGYFKNRNDDCLRAEYKMHDLEGDFSSFISLHLFPGQDGKDDIVIVFKIHRNDHVVFHGIGNHEQAYDRNRLKVKGNA